MFSYTLTPTSMNLFIDSKPHTIDNTHINYASIREAVRQYGNAPSGFHQDALLKKIKGWLDVKSFIAKFTEGAIQVGEDAVLFHGQPVKGTIAERLIALVAEGFSPAPLARFLLKLQSNPSVAARDELYLWLETSKMPICDDGDFLAYKAVREDYKSFYDQETDNSIGKVLEMPREDVDPDRDNTCSRGYHFCSLDYLGTYGRSGRTVICKIDPSEVVTIPSDYSNQKGRAWRYKIVDEVAKESQDVYLSGVHIASVSDEGVSDGTTVAVMDTTDAEAGYTLTEADYAFVGSALSKRDDPVHKARRESIRAVLDGVSAEMFSVFIWADLPQGSEYWSNLPWENMPQEALEILRAYLTLAERNINADTAVNDPANWVWTTILPQVDLPSEPDAVEAAKSGKYEVTLSNGSTTVSLSELKAMLKEHGQRGTSRLTGIPRTTLQDWISKYNL